MNVNKKIVGAVVIIGGSGILASWSGKKPITKVILGSYILMLVLSILDFFGGPLSNLASAIAMIAALYVLLHEFPWASLLGSIGSKTTTQGG